MFPEVQFLYEGQKSILFVILWWFDIEVKLFSGELLVDVQNVLTSLLEVTRWVVGACDPKTCVLSVIQWFVENRLTYKNFKDRAQKLDSWLYLSHWVFRLDRGRDGHNVDPLSADQVTVRNHRNVDIYEN